MTADPDAAELTVTEAAEFVHRDPETVRRWVRAGRLPCRRAGRTILVLRDDVMDLVAGGPEPALLPLPEAWHRTSSGAPLPDVTAALRRSRAGR